MSTIILNINNNSDGKTLASIIEPFINNKPNAAEMKVSKSPNAETLKAIKSLQTEKRKEIPKDVPFSEIFKESTN